MQKTTKYKTVLLILFGISAIFNLAAFSKTFCDRYTEHVYPHIADTFGKLSAPLPFAAGEVLAVLGGVLLLTALAVLILLPFLRKKQGYRRFCGRIWKTVLAVLNVLLLLTTFQYLIPVRCTPIAAQSSRTDFSYEEIYRAEEYIVNGANEAAAEIPLDENGMAVFPSAEELDRRAMDALAALAPEYPRLAGYYPPVKNSLFSDILERMNIGGMTLEYTMELIHNRYSCQPLYLPVLDTHEMAHHKGFYRESEAEFISTLAMIRSEDPFLRLSGYIEIERFMTDAYNQAVDVVADEMIAAGELEPLPDHISIKDPRLREYLLKLHEHIRQQPYFSSLVNTLRDQSDGIATKIYQADSHPIDNMPAVNEAIGEIADVGWETQAAVLKEHNYDGMALLYLQYFDGKLY